MSMDTSLTIEQILLALRDCGMWNKRSDIMVPNLSWGLLPYEADFVVVSKSGYMTEVEIKRSWEDFKADFGKAHNHDAEQVYQFYYCVPESIVTKVRDFLKEKYDAPHFHRPAVLYYDERGCIRQLRDDEYPQAYFGSSYASALSPNVKHRKLFLEEQLTVARLGQLRYWSLMEKVNKNQSDS